jgi:hypothetical protein
MIHSGWHSVWDAHLVKLGACSNLNLAAAQFGEAVRQGVENLSRAMREAAPMLAEALRRMP